MIMNECFKEEIKDFIKSLPDSVFQNSLKGKKEILADEDCIERLWINYQKEVEEYECDPEYAIKDTLLEVLGINIAGQPFSSQKDILKKTVKFRRSILWKFRLVTSNQAWFYLAIMDIRRS